MTATEIRVLTGAHRSAVSTAIRTLVNQDFLLYLRDFAHPTYRGGRPMAVWKKKEN